VAPLATTRDRIDRGRILLQDDFIVLQDDIIIVVVPPRP
jgi:hypothetical protein